MTFAEYDYDMDIAAQREEAMEIGMERGISTGIAIGEERGAYEKALATARNFLALGVATQEQIALATGLSLTEIKSLEQKT